MADKKDQSALARAKAQKPESEEDGQKPASRLHELKAGTRHVAVVDFPGIEGAKVGLRVLSVGDRQAAEMETAAEFGNAGVHYHEGTVEAWVREKVIRQLWRALRDPENPAKPFAASVDELKELLSADEKDALAQKYNEMEERVSPPLETLSDADFDMLLESVKKKPDPEALSSLGSSTLVRLVLSLASRQQS